MVCLGNICINTLHKGDNDDNNNKITSGIICPFSKQDLVVLCCSIFFCHNISMEETAAL
jgi:hypothetical protein